MKGVLRLTGLCRSLITKTKVQEQQAVKHLAAGLQSYQECQAVRRFHVGGQCKYSEGRGNKHAADSPRGRNNGNGEAGPLVGRKIKEQTTLSIPADKCGLVIGKGGENIKFIRSTSGADVQLQRDLVPNPEEKIFKIRGEPMEVQTALYMIQQKIGMMPQPPDKAGKGLSHKASTVPANPSDVIRNIVRICKSGKNQLVASFEVQAMTKVELEKPIVFSADEEKVLLNVLTTHPLNDLGVALLKFVLKHGEKDSQFERQVLTGFLQDYEQYNALGLATIIESVSLMNTKHRCTVVNKFTKTLMEGLQAETDSYVIKSFHQYKNTPLLQYLLNTIYRCRTHTNLKSVCEGINFVVQNGLHDYSLVQKLENNIRDSEYKRFRFSPVDLKNLLSSTVLSDSKSVLYLRVLSLHLKYNLSLIQDPGDIDGKTRSVFIACLVSYAMKGFYDKEVIDTLVDKASLMNVKDPLEVMKIVSALSMLKHEGVADFKDNVTKILKSGSILKRFAFKDVRPLVEQQWLGEDHLKQLIAREVASLEKQLKTGVDEVSYNSVSTYFLLKAYSEIDLGVPVTGMSDEEAVLKALPPTEDSISPLKKSLQFVLGELLGDKNLVQSFYINTYGHLIDVQFYLDQEGKICPESHDAGLTRFVVLLPEPSDMICCVSDEEETFEPRGVYQLKINQLSKLKNTEVITVYFNEWKELGNRHRRKEFLKKEIDARMAKRQSQTTSS